MSLMVDWDLSKWTIHRLEKGKTTNVGMARKQVHTKTRRDVESLTSYPVAFTSKPAHVGIVSATSNKTCSCCGLHHGRALSLLERIQAL